MDRKLIRVSNSKVLNLTFDEVIEKYEGLIINLIKKWSFKYDLDDLKQMAAWGLWDAYKFHNYKNGCTFGTLAQKTIINYLSWYRQNNNKDKIKRDTSKITDICSYDSNDGFISSFTDGQDNYSNVEYKIIIDNVMNKLKEQNQFLRVHEQRASERNLNFLRLIAAGYTQNEISKMYNLSISTVQRALYKEYSRIRKFLRVETYQEIIS